LQRIPERKKKSDRMKKRPWKVNHNLSKHEGVPVTAVAATAVEVRDIYKEYNPGGERIMALGGVTCSIKQGDLVAITGPSGSGKSTLLNMIGLLDSPTSGEISIDGREVSSASREDRTALRLNRIGFVFQFFNLQRNLTALENVMIPCWLSTGNRRQARERAEALLGSVGLGDRLDHLPQELSGGQQQRVAIARALVNSPSIVLADEPTGNLDSKSTAEIIELFREINRNGQTIIMVTHEPDIAVTADYMLELVDGRIANDSREYRGN